ncbi:MAG: hypothetical protein ABEJ91_01060 [Candidatus Nanohaloarchaea archaeon]
MDIEQLKEQVSDGFEEDLKYLGISFAVLLLAIGAHNAVTPDEPLKVGPVELDTKCTGIEAGICLGVQERTHTTYNYDNYEEVERGTENFYRRVEAELMLQAYSICDSGTSGMEWLSEASYLNKSGEEWSQDENVDLLPCSQVTYRNLTES